MAGLIEASHFSLPNLYHDKCQGIKMNQLCLVLKSPANVLF